MVKKHGSLFLMARLGHYGTVSQAFPLKLSIPNVRINVIRRLGIYLRMYIQMQTTRYKYKLRDMELTSIQVC